MREDRLRAEVSEITAAIDELYALETSEEDELENEENVPPI